MTPRPLPAKVHPVETPTTTRKPKAKRVVVAPVAKSAADQGVDGSIGQPSGANGLEEIVDSIGPKLRELRVQRGMSLQQLAERSDVSAAAIHKIERSGMVPTITTLLKIAGALNRPVSYFVEETQSDNRPVSFIPAGSRRPLFTSHQGIDLAGISGPYGRFFLAGALSTIEVDASSGKRPMEHPGEELLYMLEGVLELDVDGERYRLTPGDALHFRTDRPHRWSNHGTEPAKAVWLALRPF
jgi:transcriptional regulator with XRE-family HTH domain